MKKRDFEKEIEYIGNLMHSLMCTAYGMHRLIESLEDRCDEISLALKSDDGGCDDDL